MQALGCRTVEAYLRKIDRIKELRDHFELLMTVSISRFFRDRRLWETLQREVFPELARRHPERFRIWSAGCACGEEVYSLKMAWEEWAANRPTSPRLEIVATDMSSACLHRARRGEYPRSSLKELPDPIRNRYLEELPDRGAFKVRPRLKKGIQWEVHHLLSDPPGSGFHLVFLRNSVLTYYAEPLKRVALSRVLKGIVHGGFLVIGSHEKIPEGFGGRVTPYKSHRFIFRVT
jgi:chemotaxis protein methyltransferase CheR